MAQRTRTQALVLLVSLVLLVLERPCAAPIRGLPPSPCPSIYSYEVDQNGQTVGLITLLTPPRYAGVHLLAQLVSTVPVHRDEVGELAVKGGPPRANEATRDVVAGRRRVLEYYLRFPPGKPTPALRSLTVNGDELCTAREPPFNVRSTITLNAHLLTGVTGAPEVPGREFLGGDSFGGGDTFGSGGSFGGGFEPEPFVPARPRPTQRPAPMRPAPTLPPLDPEPVPTRRPISRPPPLPIDEIEETGEEPILDPLNCGVSALNNALNPLVVYGEETARGQWPWQTAIFRNNESVSSSVTFNFQCGGTLISRKHVISAAHCVVMLRERKRIQVIGNSDILISLGKYNIRSWTEEHQQLKDVQKITIHPNYDPDTLRNDLSIIELASMVVINQYVKPICLWDSSPDLSRIVGEVGTVGGWGRDESGSLSDKLRIGRMPIVSQETCLRSDTTFYHKFTSENTFCAGFRNGTTVCNGDSGGGLHIRLENPKQKGQKTWYLRGIVSLSMLEVGASCDTHNYVVFTDVAKYMTWLLQQIN